MIRFVDLTNVYWTDHEETAPMCAFLDTVTNRFIENDTGSHVCVDLNDVRGLGNNGKLGTRCLQLLPPQFFGEVKP